MMNHRGRQHFLGQAEEIRRERAGDDGGIFHEVDDLLEQAGLPDGGGIDAAAEAARVHVELARHAALALFTIEQHEVLAQLRAIVGDAAHLQRAARAAAAGQHAMPVGHRAGAHFLHRRRLREHAAAHHERHHASAVQEQNPADRPPEQQFAAAIVQPRVPVHLLRERQLAQRRGEHVRKDVDRGLAAFTPREREIGPFRRVDPFQLGDLDAVLAREADRGGRGLAVGTERRGDGRAADRLLEIALTFGDARDRGGQAARGREGFDRGPGRQPEARRASRPADRRAAWSAAPASSRAALHTRSPVRVHDPSFDVQVRLSFGPLPIRRSRVARRPVRPRRDRSRPWRCRRPVAARAGCRRCVR